MKMKTDTILNTPDCMDHLSCLIEVNFDKMAKNLRFEKAVADGTIDIGFEDMIRRWIKTFGMYELTDEQIADCAAEIIGRQQAGQTFRYKVSRTKS